MEVFFEAAPFIKTYGGEIAKDELYNSAFSVNKIANVLGDKPVKGYGFWESDNAYADRLEKWNEAENSVLFEDWSCKDMIHWYKLTNKHKNITIEIRENSYTVNCYGKTFEMPILPDTIDHFITDCKRMGIKLYWKDKVVAKYHLHNISPSTKEFGYEWVEWVRQMDSKDGSTKGR